ncbi:helix-turn-helix transcriptional regulator [Bacillus sp. FSL K6-1000]|uniref:helix-turn-helix domain-containing protein n=1 Tax=Bacillus sp. FSL K6-1000 TaxID=2921458 RepID=UPI003159EB68
MNRETASFAEKIKKIRSERNETQRQFGLVTGFSSSYVCKLEKGKANPSHSSLVQLSEKLNLPPVYFF